MKDLLKTQFTLVTGDGYYISYYMSAYGDSYMPSESQCPYLTFDDSVGDCWDLWYKLSNSDEFSYTTVHVMQIDKHVISY